MRLQVILERGKVDLEDGESSDDVYCECRWADSAYQSKIVRSSSLKWNEEFEMAPAEEVDFEMIPLVIEILAKGEGTTHSMGSAALSLGDLVMGLEKNFWVKLEGQTGDCRVQIGLTALDFGMDMALEEGIQRMRTRSLRSSGRVALSGSSGRIVRH